MSIYNKIPCSIKQSELDKLNLAMQRLTECTIKLTSQEVQDLYNDGPSNVVLGLTKRQCDYLDAAADNKQGCQLSFTKTQLRGVRAYPENKNLPVVESRNIVERAKKKLGNEKPVEDVDSVDQQDDQEQEDQDNVHFNTEVLSVKTPELPVVEKKVEKKAIVKKSK